MLWGEVISSPWVPVEGQQEKEVQKTSEVCFTRVVIIFKKFAHVHVCAYVCVHLCTCGDTSPPASRAVIILGFRKGRKLMEPNAMSDIL